MTASPKAAAAPPPAQARRRPSGRTRRSARTRAGAPPPPHLAMPVRLLRAGPQPPPPLAASRPGASDRSGWCTAHAGAPGPASAPRAPMPPQPPPRGTPRHARAAARLRSRSVPLWLPLWQPRKPTCRRRFPCSQADQTSLTPAMRPSAYVYPRRPGDGGGGTAPRRHHVPERLHQAVAPRVAAIRTLAAAQGRTVVVFAMLTAILGETEAAAWHKCSGLPLSAAVLAIIGDFGSRCGSWQLLVIMRRAGTCVPTSRGRHDHTSGA